MAKIVKKNKSREYREKIARYSAQIEVALNDGHTTKTAIGDATGLKLWEINDVFTQNVLLHAKFANYRRTLVDTAADNLEDILKNPNHPQNFQATTYVLKNYKSDLDTHLEAKSANEIEVDVRSSDTNKDITIVFSSNKTKDD